MTQTRHPLSERFHTILTEVGAMHDSKQADYGTDYDPFANVRESTKFGVPGWAGCAIRMNDKMVRLQKATQDTLDSGYPNLRNEGVLDTFLDTAVYAIIGYILYEDWQHEMEWNAMVAMNTLLTEQEPEPLDVDIEGAAEQLETVDWAAINQEAIARNNALAQGEVVKISDWKGERGR